MQPVRSHKKFATFVRSSPTLWAKLKSGEVTRRYERQAAAEQGARDRMILKGQKDAESPWQKIVNDITSSIHGEGDMFSRTK